MNCQYPKISNLLAYKRIDGDTVVVINHLTQEQYIFDLEAARYSRRLDGHMVGVNKAIWALGIPVVLTWAAVIMNSAIVFAVAVAAIFFCCWCRFAKDTRMCGCLSCLRFRRFRSMFI